MKAAYLQDLSGNFTCARMFKWLRKCMSQCVFSGTRVCSKHFARTRMSPCGFSCTLECSKHSKHLVCTRMSQCGFSWPHMVYALALLACAHAGTQYTLHKRENATCIISWKSIPTNKLHLTMSSFLGCPSATYSNGTNACQNCTGIANAAAIRCTNATDSLVLSCLSGYYLSGNQCLGMYGLGVGGWIGLHPGFPQKTRQARYSVNLVPNRSSHTHLVMLC